MYRALMVLLAVTLTPVVAAAQQPCTTDARQIVNELYRHMLERQSEAASGHWVQQLQSGGMTVRDVVREIAKSPEHTERFFNQEAGEAVPYERSVARFYRHVLARQPDAAGQRAFAQLAQREGAGAVVDHIVNSAEYTEQFGDWGVPGSGGTRYCAPGSRTVSQTPTPGVGGDDRSRFAGMDRNGDGVITLAEWRGNYQSFGNQDWNNDGVLSGDEVNPAPGRGPARTAGDTEARRAERFAALDINNNGRIEAREWDGTVTAFNRLDVNNDNVLHDRNAEVVNSGVDAPRAVATTGQEIRVEGRERWTDTFMNVRAGDTLVLNADGTVRLSADSNDVANAGGALSGRRAADAPFANQTAGALIGRIGGGRSFSWAISARCGRPRPDGCTWE